MFCYILGYYSPKSITGHRYTILHVLVLCIVRYIQPPLTSRLHPNKQLSPIIAERPTSCGCFYLFFSLSPSKTSHGPKTPNNRNQSNHIKVVAKFGTVGKHALKKIISVSPVDLFARFNRRQSPLSTKFVTNRRSPSCTSSQCTSFIQQQQPGLTVSYSVHHGPPGRSSLPAKASEQAIL